MYLYLHMQVFAILFRNMSIVLYNSNYPNDFSLFIYVKDNLHATLRDWFLIRASNYK